MDFVYYKNLKVDVYIPNKKGFKTIVYFHGGGLVSGNRSDEWVIEFCEALRKEGFCVFNFDYSLYPNVKFPDYIVDAAYAVKCAINKSKELGGNGDIYVSGSSAGAYLTMMLCSNKKYLKDIGVNPLQIKGWISDSAQLNDHFNVIKYELGKNPNLQRISKFSPLFFIKPGFVSSPILLLVYKNDMFCRVEQNQIFKKCIDEFGVNTKIKLKILNGNHCDGSSKKNKNGEYQTIVEIKKFIKN